MLPLVPLSLIILIGISDATALRNSHFGDGTGPYHLSHVGCRGEERTLLQCSYGRSTIGYHTCPSGHDAGVRCDGIANIYNLLFSYRTGCN